MLSRLAKFFFKSSKATSPDRVTASRPNEDNSVEINVQSKSLKGAKSGDSVAESVAIVLSVSIHFPHLFDIMPLTNQKMGIRDLIPILAQVLIDRDPDLRRIKNIRQMICEGLDTLNDCTMALAKSSRDGFGSLKYTSAALLAIGSQGQRALYLVIGMLLESTDWPTHDEELVANEDFDISAAIWLLILGPRRILQGLSVDMTVSEVLLQAEEEWLASHLGSITFEQDRENLARFATELRLWGFWAAVKQSHLAE